MRKTSENATITFEPEAVSENCKVTFTKISNANGKTVYGKVEKNNAEVGSISYEQKGNFLITSLKPADRLTKEEVATIYQNVPTWVNEVLDESDDDEQG